ncbi:cation:proton antiporter [Euhalothece natronophila Z-M001]|uniref:Cation:proton antiporter n=1 Tax=Euhalothece natronophila Z-M001 TaxID=522448 RepID=A0A5B8NM92_9CHRO|nr:cation:proton antiporter [Euhalothece natronophila]QDZ39400.1 cation:proton antiporter [Euhalothece natronophila Z-M001]
MSHLIVLPFAQILPVPLTDPVAVFLTILAIMLIAPLLFERMQLPGLVGLILAGVIVGPNVLGLLERDSTIVLLGTVGLLFLMFLAGLETSLDELKDSAKEAAFFGLTTFLLPMALGTAGMYYLLDYSLLASVLVASTFASHTLIALPILSKLGIMQSQPVKMTLGATLVTNVLALLVLAVVLRAYDGELTIGFWLFLIPALTIYTLATLWGVPRLGRWFFRKFGHDESAEFIFVLATLFVISYIANLIDIEPIIGAFLAGIAITQIIPQFSPLMNRIQFIGNTLFIPFFLISVGMLIDPLILIQEPQSLLIATVIIIIEVVSKYLAAWGSGKIFGIQFPGIMVMFGLSSAQAASTLAAVTIAFEVGLVDEVIVNGIVAMILVTCIASPWVTQKWGKQFYPEKDNHQDQPAVTYSETLAQRVLVPVANPNTEDNLLQLAIILAKKTKGTVLPLHILSDKSHVINYEDRKLQMQLLSTAEMVAHAAVTNVQTIGRIDDAIDRGVIRTAFEYEATLIICGWKGYSTQTENFFGSILDRMIKNAPVPLLITRFTYPIENTKRLIVAITEQEIQSDNIKMTAIITNNIADALKAIIEVIIMPVGNRITNPPTSARALGFRTDQPVITLRGKTAKKISNFIEQDDLLILNTHTQVNSLLNLSNQLERPEAISRMSPDTSMIVINFPNPIS